MAQTQAQWFAKIQSWVPTWVFEDDTTGISTAIFQAMALVLSTVEQDAEDTVAQTFIGSASGAYLDLHGFERSTDRIANELDQQFAVRIRTKSLLFQGDIGDLITTINQLLIRGVAAIREDYQGSVYFSRGYFLNRGEVVVTPITNCFTVVVDKQLALPNSFISRSYFIDRDNYFGTTDSSAYVFELILNAINDNKALGTLYRVIERLG